MKLWAWLALTIILAMTAMATETLYDGPCDELSVHVYLDKNMTLENITPPSVYPDCTNVFQEGQQADFTCQCKDGKATVFMDVNFSDCCNGREYKWTVLPMLNKPTTPTTVQTGTSGSKPIDYKRIAQLVAILAVMMWAVNRYSKRRKASHAGQEEEST